MPHTAYLAQEEAIAFLRDLRAITGADFEKADFDETHAIACADVDSILAVRYAVPNSGFDLSTLSAAAALGIKQLAKYALAKCLLDRRLFAFDQQSEPVFLAQYKQLMEEYASGDRVLPGVTSDLTVEGAILFGELASVADRNYDRYNDVTGEAV